jgi:3-methylcrotonyl-CoA carboxylase alpha subunit
MEISEHCSSDPPEAVLYSAPTLDHSGNKLTHRGYHGASQEIAHLLASAKEVGYPLLIKPTHGGGGKGMRVVHSHEVLEEEIMIAKREALKSFGNDEVLLERWLERPRHVEVQVFADEMGGVVSLWERDCSVQRRHQSEFESESVSGASR